MDHRTHHISGEPSRLLSPRAYPESLVEEFPDLAPGLVISTFRSRPLWGGMAWRRAFPGRADQSAPARRMVGRLLADTGRMEDARWVAAELVSNALRHSRSGQARGFFVVEVLRGADVVRIVVYDLGGGLVPDFSRTPGSSPELAEHGRGLAGVAELAVRVGAAGDAVTGHAVWAELALTGTTARVARRADGAPVVSEVEAFDLGAQVPELGYRPELASAALTARETLRPVACQNLAPMMREETACDVPGSIPDALMASVSRPGSDGGEVVVGVRLSGPLLEVVVRQGGDRVSAFGQESWAQQALAWLRREWPDWAFLVVRYQWLALRGKHVVISATGPEELRQALPPIPVKPTPTEPASAESASSASAPIEHGATEIGLLATDLDGARTRRSVSPPPALGAGAGAACGGDGAGAGLSDTLTAVAPPLGVLAAERSGTGTWAVAAADRHGWRGGPQGWSWWTWGKRRDRSRAGESGCPMGRDRPLGREKPRHRRVRLKLTAVAAVPA
ncbi:ATP-binding protein [Nonomuraea sp. NPDC002799]